MKLTSAAFNDGEFIPIEYTADGQDISPPLSIIEPPNATQSFALIVDDPDAPAGTFAHWIVFDIPSDTAKIEEGVSPTGKKGKNDFGQLEYGGPAPPFGTHRYKFRIYALDTRLGLDGGATKAEVEKAMKGHVLDKDVLTGKYSR